MKTRNRTSLLAQNERGSVLILIAISLIMILSMLALVVDYGALTMTKSDLRDTARAAASGALQAYVTELNAQIATGAVIDPSTPNSPIYESAMNVAIEKAAALAGLNLSVSRSSSFREGQVEDYSILGTQNENYSGGYVQAGTWHFVEPSGDRPNCSPLPDPFAPCFEVGPIDEPANAIRVVLTDDAGGVTSFFSEAAGITMGRVSGGGAAAFIPRQGVVAFDLSFSTTRTTHLGETQAGVGKASNYAFYIDPLNTAGASSCPNDWSSKLRGANRTPPREDQKIWNEMYDDSSAGGATPGPKDHFKDDYQCVEVPVNYDGTTVNELFGIETGLNADRPEPLSSILDATYSLLDSFARRRVVGDRVGVIGFDREIMPQRRLPENPVSGVLLAEPTIGDVNFDSFQDALDTSLPITDVRRKSKFLFPRTLTGKPGSTDRKIAQTNIQIALEHSMEMLESSETFDVADNFVLLVTDGLTNCVQDLANATAFATGAGGTQVPQPCFYLNSSSPSIWTLNSNYFTKGFNEIYNLSGGNVTGIIKKFVDKGVSVHVALVGENVGPHTLVRKSPAGGCMSFNEASAQALTMVNTVNTPAYDPASATDKYFFPNNFASISAATNGRWWPIQPPCNTIDPVILTDQCENASDSSPIINTGGDMSEWDSEGRLFCNPEGLNVREQLLKLVETIMEDSPVVFVE